MTLTIAEQMLYSVTRITTFKGGSVNSFGTGFFYAIELDSDNITSVLVTNRHVFDGCDRIDISLPLRDEHGHPSSQFHKWEVEFRGSPIGHPDPSVDLALVSLTGLHRINTDGSRDYPFFVSLRQVDIPAEGEWSEFDAIEEVVMIGCPNGLFDEVNNSPIIRRGITATHLGRNYEGRKEFVIDMACFPGSSGSPVFLYSKGAIFDRKSQSVSFGIDLKLLGILYAGPTFNQRGQIVMTNVPEIAVTATMHLGYVIKADQLREFDRLAHERFKDGSFVSI